MDTPPIDIIGVMGFFVIIVFWLLVAAACLSWRSRVLWRDPPEDPDSYVIEDDPPEDYP